ncbi:MAG: pitrilysin family protein [Vulcanimicrobiaceae bacterium]
MSRSIRPVSVAAVALAGLLGLSGAAPAPGPIARYPTAATTDLGVTQLIREVDSDAALAGTQIFVTAGLDREPVNANGIAALVAESLVRTPVASGNGTNLPVRDAIAALGGNLTYTVDGRSVHFYVETRAERLAAAVELFAKALATPDFSPATIAASRALLTTRISETEASALSVGIGMFRRSYYSAGAGNPALGNPSTLAGLGGKDAAAFFAANYKRGGLSTSAVGAAVPALGEALKAVARALPEGAVAPIVSATKAIPTQAPRIVAHRDIGAPWVVVGYAAPAPGSKDFGAMLVLEKLLAEAFERNSATTLGFIEKSVGAFYLYDVQPASLVVYVNGTQGDPSVSLRELLVVSKSLSLKPLAADPLRHFKTAAEGQFITDSVTLSDRSYLLGTFAAQGLGSDSINAALDALERTTSADVQRVAKAYLQRYIVALVLPRASGGGAAGPQGN